MFKWLVLALSLISIPSFAGEPSAPIAAQSHFTETGFVLSVKKSVVEHLIGPEQELVPQTLTDANHNPVVIRHIQYPDMTGLSPVVAPFAYDEFIVYIPNVRLKAGYTCGGQAPGSAAFMPALYLNQQLPVTIGVKYYGFNKLLSTITASNDGFDIKAQDGTPLYSAQFGTEVPLDAQGSANFGKLASLFPSALMGRLVNADGSSSMIWSGVKLELSQAQYASLDISAIDQSLLVAGLENLVGESFETDGINSTYLGGYRIKGAFLQLTQPVPCQAPASAKPTTRR